MSQTKIKKNQPLLDMTPMVDLAFLLVTFFMLTTKFASEEPVIVDIPSSISEIKLPDNDILTITISKEGSVFFNMDGKYNRQELLSKMGDRYQIEFTEQEINSFALMTSFGMPLNKLKGFLQLEHEQQKEVIQTGIPADSLNNQLADWIVYSRMANPKLRVVLKGDRDANYPSVQKVINTLQTNNISRFNLITNMEKAS
ncbi:biopolymer transporter ExbD [Marivirga sp.]|uniref:ExbD/TolR family protein n=1 Tax=Marivirga sp. TaxID=2018662 RepID=UPI002D807F26|nr:biopolymer transporter ExbD [Marivirga sp.]HET8860887.1 biopolymer transporter ExbD [Marivirga sp.]